MNRPSGFQVNPQAMAAVSTRKEYSGLLDLGTSQDRDTWLTPRWILDHLGSFDLDPCAADSNPNWVASRSFTKKQDGLAEPWTGNRVFLNPPFSNTAAWLRKMGEHRTGIALVPTSVESRVWSSHVWPIAGAVLLLSGRTRFCNPDGSTTTGRPLRSIALIAWSETDCAVLESAPFGGILLREWSQRK